jgi:hypothetical protein
MYKGSMMYHPLTEEITDVVSLGFLVHVDPVNHPKDYVEDKIKAKLQKEAKCEPHQIPIFKVVISSPSHTQDDNRLWTKSYNVQVKQKHAKAMIRLIKQAYKVNKDFMFYQMRHKVPATFKAAIKAQYQFLNQARVVPIEGIPRDMIWAMKSKLLAPTRVEEVLPHWITSSDGRWNLLTHANAFSGVIRYLEKRSNLRGCVAGIAMNMATIRVIVPKRRRRCMEHKCQKLKKMRMRKGLQVLHPDKMGLQVLDPAQGCNGQVRPRVVLHGNENHECSNSAVFFQRKNRKSVLAVCAIRLNGQTDRVIQTVRIAIQTQTVAIPQ